ncbi:MAG: hypothetical protein QNJ46_14225 [Leptolyngbyaceae cyanobacterium MO_188.B28]|nr:hypothetical protein [Leptolyngbyaceae cyanobacterium MO_188.B28]
MLDQRNVLTLLGCSGSLALTFAFTQPAMANSSPLEEPDEGLPNLVQADSNPIRDALTCNCAQCMLGQKSGDFQERIYRL